MSVPLESYLRTHRKRSGLSQDDLAFLLGSASGAKVSRYERRTIQPKLETALAYEAIFRIPTRELFAGLYQKVEIEVVARAQVLGRELAGSQPRKAILNKMALLDALCAGQPPSRDKRS